MYLYVHVCSEELVLSLKEEISLLKCELDQMKEEVG